jgi:hypothetical protein
LLSPPGRARTGRPARARPGGLFFGPGRPGLSRAGWPVGKPDRWSSLFLTVLYRPFPSYTVTIPYRYRSLPLPFLSVTVPYRYRSLPLPFLTVTVPYRYRSLPLPFLTVTVPYRYRSLQFLTVTVPYRYRSLPLLFLNVPVS